MKYFRKWVKAQKAERRRASQEEKEGDRSEKSIVSVKVKKRKSGVLDSSTPSDGGAGAAVAVGDAAVSVPSSKQVFTLDTFTSSSLPCALIHSSAPTRTHKHTRTHTHTHTCLLTFPRIMFLCASCTLFSLDIANFSRIRRIRTLTLLRAPLLFTHFVSGRGWQIHQV